jgi:hypothetical protein
MILEIMLALPFFFFSCDINHEDGLFFFSLIAAFPAWRISEV